MPPSSLDPPPPPTTEAELLRHRPVGYRYGAFPRVLLSPGERVLFEGRPVLTTSRRWVLGFLGFWIGINTLALLVVFALLPSFPQFEGLAPIFLISGLGSALLYGVPFYLVVLSWARSAFALTDRRVLAVSGLLSANFQFAYLGEVQGLDAPHTPTTDLVFRIERDSESTGPSGPKRVRSVLVWDSVGAAPRVYEFVQSAFALGTEPSRTRAAAIHRREWMQAGRAVCAYCGNLIALVRGDPIVGLCPRCSAPLERALEWAEPEPPPADARSEIALLRPTVHLGRDALEWSRPFLLSWAILLLGLPIFFLLPMPAQGEGTSPAQIALLIVLVLVLAPLFYLLAFQALRKWRTAVRTLTASLSEGRNWIPARLAPLRRRFRLAAAAVGASLVAVVASVVEFSWLTTQAPADGGSLPFNDLLGFDATLTLFAVCLVIGVAALVTSYPLLLEGSEVPAVERPGRIGTRFVLLGIPLGFLPLPILEYGLATDSSAMPAPEWFYLAPAGPLLAVVGISFLLHAYDEWLWRADRMTAIGGGGSGVLPTARLRRGAFGYIEGSGLSLRQSALLSAHQFGSLPRRVRFVLFAVLVAVILVAAIDATGYQVIPIPPPPAPLSFDQAELAANATVAGFGAGPWSVVAAESAEFPVPVTVPSHWRIPPGMAPIGFQCYATQVGNLSDLVLPGSTGELGSGNALGWLVTMQNASGGGVMVALLAGADAVVDTYDLAGCLHNYGGGARLNPVPSGGIDSGTALRAAESAGGQQFLSSYPRVGFVFELTGGFSQGNVTHGPQWTVILTTCSPTTFATTSGRVSDPQFIDSFNMTTGAPVGSPITGDEVCD